MAQPGVKEAVQSGVVRMTGLFRSGSFQRQPSLSASEASDMELPILESHQALSDGYPSPRPRQPHSPPDPASGRGDPDETLSQQGEGLASALALKASPARSRMTQVVHAVMANWERVLVLAIIITLIVLFCVKGVSIFKDILDFFQAQNNWVGWAIFLVLFCVDVALFLPGVVLILGAGFVFGFWKGLLAVWAGGAIGQALAFLLARYLVRDWVVGFVASRWSKWELVDKMIELEGWKLLLLLRLSPLVPYNLLNITMATTRIHFVQFALASAVGIIPECAVLCYFGSLAEDISQIVGGQAHPRGPVTYVLIGLSLAFCVTAALAATFLVRRAVRRADAHLSSVSGQSLQRMGSDGDVENGFMYSPRSLPPEGYYDGLRSRDSLELSPADLAFGASHEAVAGTTNGYHRHTGSWDAEGYTVGGVPSGREVAQRLEERGLHARPGDSGGTPRRRSSHGVAADQQPHGHTSSDPWSATVDEEEGTALQGWVQPPPPPPSSAPSSKRGDSPGSEVELSRHGSRNLDLR